jgi:hypothetical protein
VGPSSEFNFKASSFVSTRDIASQVSTDLEHNLSLHTCFYPIILRTLDYLDIGLVDHYASGTICSHKLGDLTVPLAYWIIILTHIYASLICPTTFQVASRYDAQRYALQNLPGRHSWRLIELPIATGFVDEPEKLKALLTHLFGRNWKEYFMYLVLFFSLVVGNK